MKQQWWGLGRIATEPELKTTPSGISVCSFRIAVDRDYVKDSGEKQVDFLDIVAWRQQAEFVAQYCPKGRLVLVTGTVQTRQWTAQDGSARRTTEIVASDVKGASPVNAQQQPAQPAPQQPPQQPAQPYYDREGSAPGPATPGYEPGGSTNGQTQW